MMPSLALIRREKIDGIVAFRVMLAEYVNPIQALIGVAKSLGLTDTEARDYVNSYYTDDVSAILTQCIEYSFKSHEPGLYYEGSMEIHFPAFTRLLTCAQPELRKYIILLRMGRAGRMIWPHTRSRSKDIIGTRASAQFLLSESYSLLRTGPILSLSGKRLGRTAVMGCKPDLQGVTA